MLEDNSTNSIFLAPPQVYELSRLIPIQSYHELREFARKREPKGCERWLPIISTAMDGAVSLLPGNFISLSYFSFLYAIPIAKSIIFILRVEQYRK